MSGTETSAPRVSVIIPVHNMGGTIGACIHALRRQTVPLSQYEIIVVDDGSTDDSVEQALRAGATRVLRKPRGGFAAAARNMGIHAAEGDILCFTDADCRPSPDWLAQITLPLADPELSGVKGTYTSEQRSLVARFVQLEYEEKYARLASQPRISFIDFYSAAFRRQVLVTNGAFDETFPNSEDRELSFRLATRGYQMVFQPSAVVAHIHAHTLPDYFMKKTRNGYWTAQVVRRFPTHGVDDSYTPQTMKLHILLVALLFGSLGLTLFTPWAGILALGSLLLFLVTTLPFVRRAWQRDRPVALVAPLLLAARASALGLGYSWGLVRPAKFRRETVTISGTRYVAKRFVDILAGLAGVALTALVLPLVALQTRSTREMWHREPRVGQNGDVFLMRAFCPAPVVPGRWRKLPYFWHVLRGEMSLVGPRPETEAEVEQYADWHRQRLAVKPGLVSPTSHNNADCRDERIRQEIDYIANYSWRQDLRLVRQAFRR